MSSKSGEQCVCASRSVHDTILVTFISLIVAGGTVGGFLIGRNTSRDAFINKVNRQAGIGNTSLLSAGVAPLSLFQAVEKEIDDPLVAQALAKLYSVPIGDRGSLVKRLRDVAWVPAYQPAPFVGHMARPNLGAEPHINMLGFRDERQSYVAKPGGTVRIFITGGSTAWGSGASSQKNTISYLLERMLNERVSRSTGFHYEVINAAFPAWSTTQEKLLIQQRLVDMHPDIVLMFSGTNDAHLERSGRDVRWSYGLLDQNYVMLLNELYKSNGRPEWTFPLLASSHPLECSDLALVTARNVEEAAFAAERVQARLIFALQPNVASTGKHLSKYEQKLPEVQNKTYWDSWYQALRDRLSRINAPNYQLLDLSRSFAEIDANTEVFVDSYHFADLGNRLIAQALSDQIDWRSITPGPAVADPKDVLNIVSFEPTTWPAGKPFNRQRDGTSLLRLVTNPSDRNLLVVFDRSVLPTVVVDSNIAASIPTSFYATKGDHIVYVADFMTGETSKSILFHSQ
jgi:hypothetical protein